MPQSKPLIIAIASLAQRRRTLMEMPQFDDRTRAMLHHVEEELDRIQNCYLPSGSGFDGGTQILLDECSGIKVAFQTAFHHMNGDGFYTGWTHHKVTVRASFTGYDITINGRNLNNIKEYISDTFYHALNDPIEYRAVPRKTA